MPHFSRAMREHPSGELWAGRVSMTTSAILTMVTGARGGFEQVVFNVDPSPPPYDAWLRQAKAQGMRMMHVGDPAWPRMYGSSFAESQRSPGSAEAITGCPLRCACRVAWRLGELSQHSVTPHV
jgi:hypothetical protein